MLGEMFYPPVLFTCVELVDFSEREGTFELFPFIQAYSSKMEKKKNTKL